MQGQLVRQKAALDSVTQENDKLRREENMTHVTELNTARVEASRCGIS